MRDNVIRMLTDPGHLCAIDTHQCRFGDTYRPVCLEDGCTYRGPYVSEVRAWAIADEHRLKSLDKWRPVK